MIINGNSSLHGRADTDTDTQVTYDRVGSDRMRSVYLLHGKKYWHDCKGVNSKKKISAKELMGNIISNE